jgi:shikimate kinase
MKVFLIGMPGCGKSTFGKKASEQLDMDFIDLDTEIVNFAQKSINDIFGEDGEEYFRKIESSLLKSLTDGHQSFIMATGGGAPCFFDNMDFMNARGLTFYIDTDIGFLLERLTHKGINKRPLLKTLGHENLEQGLKEKLKERHPFYSKAEITLTFQQDLEEKIAEIVRARM